MGADRPVAAASAGPACRRSRRRRRRCARSRMRSVTRGDAPRSPTRRPTLDGLDLDRAAAIVADALGAGGGWLAPAEVEALLRSFGLPLARSLVATSPRAAGRAAPRLGGPVAVKAIAPGLVHKSDVGAVRLGLSGAAPSSAPPARSAAAVRAAGHRVEGYVVQAMAPEGSELLVGVVGDPAFGPLVAIGAGGTTAELIRDVQVRLAPIGRREASDMLRSLRTFPLLDGYRGRPRADVAAVRGRPAARRRARRRASRDRRARLQPAHRRPDRSGRGRRARADRTATAPSPLRRAGHLTDARRALAAVGRERAVVRLLGPHGDGPRQARPQAIAPAIARCGRGPGRRRAARPAADRPRDTVAAVAAGELDDDPVMGSGGWDQALRVWDLAAGSQLAVVRPRVAGRRHRDAGRNDRQSPPTPKSRRCWRCLVSCELFRICLHPRADRPHVVRSRCSRSRRGSRGQGVAPVAEDQRRDPEAREDQVEDRQDVGADDARVRAARRWAAPRLRGEATSCLRAAGLRPRAPGGRSGTWWIVDDPAHGVRARSGRSRAARRAPRSACARAARRRGCGRCGRARRTGARRWRRTSGSGARSAGGR